MTSRQFIRWSRLHEKRSGAARRGWLVALVAGLALAAFVYWRADAAGPIAASRAWVAGALAAFGLAFMRVPFHLYWRQDAALLAQLPIGGGALFDAAWLRCIRAAGATLVAVLIGAVPLALLDAQAVELSTTPIAGSPIAGLTPGEFVLRHGVFAAVFGLVAAGLMPAVTTWAASLVTHGKDTLELATKLAGAPIRSSETVAHDRGAVEPPGSASAILGAVPGFAATVAIVLLVIAGPWLHNRETVLSAAGVLASLAVASIVLLGAVRVMAPRVMGTILRDVSALDRQRLATLEIRPPTAIERFVASLLGEAALPYRKDARLMRRRYPMAFALGALAFIVLVIVGLSRPADPTPWLVGVLTGAGMYAIALGGRLLRPPIELPRLAATLPITREARTRAKVAWLATWLVVFVAIPLVIAAVRIA